MITFSVSNLPLGSNKWLAMVGNLYWYEEGKIDQNTAWQFSAPTGTYSVVFYAINEVFNQINTTSTRSLGDKQLVDGKTYNYNFNFDSFTETSSQDNNDVVGSSGFGGLLVLAGVGYLIYYLVKKRGKK